MPPLPDGPRSAPSRPPRGLSRLADTQSGARHARVNCRTHPPYFVDHLSVVAPPSATPGSHVRSTGRLRCRLSCRPLLVTVCPGVRFPPGEPVGQLPPVWQGTLPTGSEKRHPAPPRRARAPGSTGAGWSGHRKVASRPGLRDAHGPASRAAAGPRTAAGRRRGGRPGGGRRAHGAAGPRGRQADDEGAGRRRFLGSTSESSRPAGVQNPTSRRSHSTPTTPSSSRGPIRPRRSE